MNPYIEMFIATIGFLFFLCCATALFYDCLYKPMRDKWIVSWCWILNCGGRESLGLNVY